MRTLDGSQYFYLYFELAVYLAVMNGHYMLIETENSPKYNSEELTALQTSAIRYSNLWKATVQLI